MKKITEQQKRQFLKKKYSTRIGKSGAEQVYLDNDWIDMAVILVSTLVDFGSVESYSETSHSYDSGSSSYDSGSSYDSSSSYDSGSSDSGGGSCGD